MSKDIIPKMPKSEKDYRQQKANCNLYERTWRKKHPEEHKKNSKQLLTAIKKPNSPIPPIRKPKKEVKK